jgi:hypothetical protein
MCDFSLHHVKSRPAKVGDKLTTTNFNTGTRGFAAPEDSTTAVCILPGTELAFSAEVKCIPFRLNWKAKTINFNMAIFRQINRDVPRVHHDALEFPDGTCVLLTDLLEGQEATVLQLPAQPKTRLMLLQMAQTWADFADQAEKNSKSMKLLSPRMNFEKSTAMFQVSQCRHNSPACFIAWKVRGSMTAWKLV